MRAYYSDTFELPLPAGHRFPMAKYRLLRERVAHELPGVELHVPPAASDHVLAQAHDRQYIDRVQGGHLSAAEIRALGFPWSEAMVERSRRSCGATISALGHVLKNVDAGGIALNLAGGTHHAQPDGPQGFCVFNDIAVAIASARAHGFDDPVLVVDTDPVSYTHLTLPTTSRV